MKRQQYRFVREEERSYHRVPDFEVHSGRIFFNLLQHNRPRPVPMTYQVEKLANDDGSAGLRIGLADAGNHHSPCHASWETHYIGVDSTTWVSQYQDVGSLLLQAKKKKLALRLTLCP